MLIWARSKSIAKSKSDCLVGTTRCIIKQYYPRGCAFKVIWARQWCGFAIRPLADHPSPHVYLRLLVSLLPPSTRQPDPVAVLLGQLRFIFSSISHSLGVNRETYFPSFALHILRPKVWISSRTFYFFDPALTVNMLPWRWIQYVLYSQVKTERMRQSDICYIIVTVLS